MVGSVEALEQEANAKGRALLFAHTLGAVAGGMVTALLLQAIRLSMGSGEVSALFKSALVVLAMAATIGQSTGLGVVQSTWQVPEWWRYRLPPDMTAFFYGSLLGNGMSVAVMTSAFWIFVASSLVVGPWVAILGWLSYGGARVVGVLAGRHWNLAEKLFSPPQWRLQMLVINGIGVVAGIMILSGLV